MIRQDTDGLARLLGQHNGDLARAAHELGSLRAACRCLSEAVPTATDVHVAGADIARATGLRCPGKRVLATLCEDDGLLTIS